MLGSQIAQDILYQTLESTFKVIPYREELDACRADLHARMLKLRQDSSLLPELIDPLDSAIDGLRVLRDEDVKYYEQQVKLFYGFVDGVTVYDDSPDVSSEVIQFLAEPVSLTVANRLNNFNKINRLLEAIESWNLPECFRLSFEIMREVKKSIEETQNIKPDKETADDILPAWNTLFCTLAFDKINESHIKAIRFFYEINIAIFGYCDEKTVMLTLLDIAFTYICNLKKCMNFLGIMPKNELAAMVLISGEFCGITARLSSISEQHDAAFAKMQSFMEYLNVREIKEIGEILKEKITRAIDRFRQYEHDRPGIEITHIFSPISHFEIGKPLIQCEILVECKDPKAKSFFEIIRKQIEEEIIKLLEHLDIPLIFKREQIMDHVDFITPDSGLSRGLWRNTTAVPEEYLWMMRYLTKIAPAPVSGSIDVAASVAIAKWESLSAPVPRPCIQ